MNKKKNNLFSKSYLAGFLDGDGSIITQIVKDKTYKFGYYIRISIVFYQSSKNHWFILKLQKSFKPFGSVRKLNNGMSQFVLVDKKSVENLLKNLLPYLILKKALAKLVLEIIHDLKNIQNEIDFIKVCVKVDKTIEYTYSKTRKITSINVKEHLYKINSPVET